MASDTVPAAAPEPPLHPPTPPAHAPATGRGQQTGRGLTGLLSAVDPARPEFDLHPTSDAASAALADLHAATQGGGGASSADFGHDPTTGDTNTSKTGNSGQQQGIWRAWMLAAAKRYEQSGAARLKALDIKKARATALQVKEQRTTNRSEKFVGGNTGTNTNTQSKADKNTGAHTKNDTNASRNDGKNHHTKNQASQSGRGTNGNGNGRGGAGGGSGSGGRGPGSGGRGTGSGKDDPKNGSRSGGKTDTGKHTGPGSPAGGKGGPAGKDGKSGKDTKTPSGSGGGGTAGRGSGTPNTGKDTKAKQTASTCGDSSGIDLTKTKTPKNDKPKTPAGEKTGQPGPPGNAGKNTPGNGPAPAAGPAGPNTGPGKTPAAKPAPVDLKKNPGGKGGTKTPAPAKKTPPDPKTQPKPNQPAPGPSGGRTPGPAVDTQGAREAGYRDGTRIGRIEAKAGAYRDGVKDGRNDIKEAADREKARLDKAHAARKQQPPAPAPVIPPKPDQPPTVPPLPKDPPMPAPVQVDSINGNTLSLGGGAARPSMSRGEVRTLRGFQKRLDTKNDRMTRVAEATRTLHQHAIDQARQVTHYRELAAGVEGGEKLLAALARLEEAANDQASKAAVIHKRSIRAAEGCRALNANTETRYGAIYKAVVDSDENAPATMSYYQEMDHA